MQDCDIVYEDVAKTEIYKVCTARAERNCTTPSKTETKCSTVYQTSEGLSGFKSNGNQLERAARV